MNFQNAQFILSAARPGTFPSDGLPQVVFAGRSNVGKSIRHQLPPGPEKSGTGGLQVREKPPNENYFKNRWRFYFVDLPGYGYPKSPGRKRNAGGACGSVFCRPVPGSAGHSRGGRAA
jgi:GTP-binding protein